MLLLLSKKWKYANLIVIQLQTFKNLIEMNLLHRQFSSLAEGQTTKQYIAAKGERIHILCSSSKDFTCFN